MLFIHVPLIVSIPGSGELKSKPTQHSVKELLSLGIQPDILVCRCDEPIGEDMRRKIALFCNVTPECVIQNTTAETLYEVPLLLAKEGLDDVVCRKLGLITPQPDLREWSAMVKREKNVHRKVEIALVGKYTQLHDAYLSVVEALHHAGTAHDATVDHPLGGLRDPDGGEHPGEPCRLRRRSRARRLRRPGHRGHDPGGPVRPGEQCALSRHLPGDADGGDGVRPPRRWAGKTPTPPSSPRPPGTPSSP